MTKNVNKQWGHQFYRAVGQIINISSKHFKREKKKKGIVLKKLETHRNGIV